MGGHGHGHDEPKSTYTGPPASSISKTIHGWSWQAYPIGMGTGAVYVLLSALEDHPKFVTGIEIFFFGLNCFFFLFNSSMMITQLFLFPKQFKRLLFDPVKGVFVPLCVLSFATIMIGTISYLHPRGIVGKEFIYILFWVYIIFALLVCYPMLMIWYNGEHDIRTFTPAWAFLVFPMMLVGVVAFNVLKVIPAEDPRSVHILAIGYVFQGLGAFMTFFYLGIYVLRVMTTGFMDGHQANGAFVACGPPGFTALALLNLGKNARTILPRYDLISDSAGEVFWAVSVMAALMLLGLALFFFFFGVFPYWFKLHKHLNEILGCWALTFPNVGWINTVRVIGDIFKSNILFSIHAFLVTIVCLVYAVLITLTMMALFKGLIFRSTDEAVMKDAMGDAWSSEPPKQAGEGFGYAPGYTEKGAPQNDPDGVEWKPPSYITRPRFGEQQRYDTGRVQSGSWTRRDGAYV